jgi:mRNA-degrading endonuclease RelE of RelBE toxin-antitoxin system
MAKQLEFSPNFKKNYKNLPENIKECFNKKISLFQNDQSHPSLNVRRFYSSSDKKIYEAYITKSYRFTFEITKETIILRNIGSHEIIDKGLV